MKRSLRNFNLYVEGSVEGWKKCLKCDFQTKRKTVLARHAKNLHERKMWYQCRECEFFCRSNDSVALHLAREHLVRVGAGYASVEPFLVTDERKISEFQKQKRKKQRSYKAMEEKIEKDRKKELPSSRLLCMFCGFKAKGKLNLSNHLNEVHERSKWYQCLDCE